MQDLTQLAIVAAALTAFVQWAKNKFATSKFGTQVSVLVLSIVLGTVYYFLRDTNLWVNMVAILSVSSTIYLWLIRPFEA